MLTERGKANAHIEPVVEKNDAEKYPDFLERARRR